MASEVHQFTATIPAGTLDTAPFVCDVVLDNRVVVQIDLEVPSGTAGLMGFYLAHSGTQLIPAEPGEWIVWDDVEREWALDDYPDSNGWQVVGYNTGDYDHPVVLRLHTNYPDATTVLPPAPTVTFVGAPAPVSALILP